MREKRMKRGRKNAREKKRMLERKMGYIEKGKMEDEGKRGGEDKKKKRGLKKKMKGGRRKVK